MARQEKAGQAQVCPLAKKCGGCDYQGIAYEEQLKKKEQTVKKLMKGMGEILPIIGAEDPYCYRNKVHAVFSRKRNGEIVSGIYQEGTHKVVPVEICQIEDQKADAIIGTIRGLLKSFKIKVYDEDTDYGLLRHVLIRTGAKTGQIMVVLVTRSPIFPSKNNFVKAIRAVHPEISTVVLNVNERKTSMVLGARNITLYGKGYIEDELCGCRFRISPTSFYQINPAQTEKLYKTAMMLARLNKRNVVVDAYCGIGTISLFLAKKAKQVYGVEIVPQAIDDARNNAKINDITNAEFYVGKAEEVLPEYYKEYEKTHNGETAHADVIVVDPPRKGCDGVCLEGMADREETVDVVFMDPPRSGSSEAFLQSLLVIRPKKIVYISCEPQTQARDLQALKKDYKIEAIQPVDMFPMTEKIETVVLLTRKE